MVEISELVAQELRAPFFKGPYLGMPIIWNTMHANKMFDELRTRAGALDNASIRDGLLAVIEDPCVGEIVRSILCNSPFLTRCLLSDLPFLKLILEQGPDTGLSSVIDEIKDGLNHELDREQLKRGLRVARKRVALLVALADITGIWSLERVTEALSDFADAATSAALSHLLRVAAKDEKICLTDDYFPEYECGYFALAMEKYGARELNYSSDIDLIIIYDPLKIDYRGRRSVRQFLVRMTRDLVAVLQDMTSDGYVFRVDLRLRPDPGSTPIAIPYGNGLQYYQNRGAGWERAAMIKARPAIGDLALGRRFMADLVPFIWPPNVDFWAQREMVKIKRQINQHRGGAEIGFHGYNIKLGRGGIREIEFFAQSHQLVYGGRDAYLRSNRTLDALSSLAEAGHINDVTADELTEAYEFLRQLEHRLQMVNDQQTQTLPSDDAGMGHVAAFMGFESIEVFQTTLTDYMMTVDRHYSMVVDDSAEPSAQRYRDLALIHVDGEDAAQLRELGFQDVDGVIGCLQRWRTAKYYALRDDRSLELMQELAPRLIEAATESHEPDLVIHRFDEFLSKLKAGVRFLSALPADQFAFDFVLDVLGSAPNLARELSRYPERLQCVLSSTGGAPPPDARVLTADCTQILGAASTDEDAHKLAGTWAAEQRFRVATHIVHHSLDWIESGRAYGNIADAAIQSLCRDQRRSGGGGDTTFDLPVVVVGFGPYGSQALTNGTSTDLLFVCEDDPASQQIDRWFCNRLLSRLTSSTPDGKLLDVNMGQSPYSARGPIITQLEPFLSFCAASDNPLAALALTQARVIFGATKFAADVNQKITAFLIDATASINLSRHGHEILPLIRVAGAAPIWDLRRCPGGLAELEILIAFLQVRAAPKVPNVLGYSHDNALGLLVTAGFLDGVVEKQLIEANHLMRRIDSFLAVAVGTNFDPEKAPGRLKASLARACRVERFEDVEAMLGQAKALVRTSLEQVLMGGG